MSANYKTSMLSKILHNLNLDVYIIICIQIYNFGPVTTSCYDMFRLIIYVVKTEVIIIRVDSDPAV